MPTFAQLSNIPRNNILGTFADLLQAGKDNTGVVGDFLLGQAPETLNNMSYGFNPTRGKGMTYGMKPEAADLANVIPTASLAGILGKSYAKFAGKQIAKQVQNGTGMLGRNMMNPRMNIAPNNEQAVNSLKISDLNLSPHGESIAKSFYNWNPKTVKKVKNNNPVSVVKLPNGQMHLLDGYHRTVQARLNGKQEIGATEVPMTADLMKHLTRDGIINGGTERAKTKYELAHELAQKNAIEMLGLPANNTAMQRAKALGYNTPAYHGTNADIQEFSTKGKGKTYDSGAFFSDNPSVAGTYTMGINNGNILPVLLRNEKHLNVEANGKNWNRLVKSTKLEAPAITKIDNETENLLAQLEGRQAGEGLTTNKKAFKKTLGKQFPDEFKYDDYFSTDDLARWANNEGYGGATFNNVIDRGPSGAMANAESSLPSNNYALFDPSNMRSRFAAFDPARRNEADLLGYSTPEMMGALAAGSGAGLLANKYDQIEQWLNNRGNN